MELISWIWWQPIRGLCGELWREKKSGLKFLSGIISQFSLEWWKLLWGNLAAWRCKGGMFCFIVSVFCDESAKTPFMPDRELMDRKITHGVSWLQASLVLLRLHKGTRLHTWAGHANLPAKPSSCPTYLLLVIFAITAPPMRVWPKAWDSAFMSDLGFRQDYEGFYLPTLA